MKKTNLKRLVILVLILCVLPVAAFARTDVVYDNRPGNIQRRYTITTTYQGSTTKKGSSTILYQEINTDSSPETVHYSHSISSTWGLSLGTRIQKSWISAEMSANYGNTEQVSITVDKKLPGHKKLTVYKRIDTRQKKWKHVSKYEYRWYGESTWTNGGTSTYYSYEKNNYPVLWSTITNAN